MARLYRTTGIVLSWRDYKEADRWYRVFTKENGKVSFRARGANKPLAKLTPHMETICESQFLLVDGRYYETVAGVERKRAFSGLYKDLSKRILAQNTLSLVDIGTQSYQANRMLYRQLIDWLSFLENAPTLSSERAGFLLGSFTLQLMELVGYKPELAHCLDCKGEIRAGGFYWHALKGGVVCTSCVLDDQEQWFNAREMEDGTLKLLRFAATKPFSDQLKPHLPGKTLIAFHESLESLIVSHFPTIPSNSLRASCMVC